MGEVGNTARSAGPLVLKSAGRVEFLCASRLKSEIRPADDYSVCHAEREARFRVSEKSQGSEGFENAEGATEQARV